MPHASAGQSVQTTLDRAAISIDGMSVCTCVSMYVCILVCMHVCMYVRVYVFMVRIYVYIYIYVCLYVRMYVSTYVCNKLLHGYWTCSKYLRFSSNYNTVFSVRVDYKCVMHMISICLLAICMGMKKTQTEVHRDETTRWMNRIETLQWIPSLPPNRIVVLMYYCIHVLTC